ncbi:MAG: hypothetical protein V7L01_24835 [Nostoc sp.]|uniref:hypothetical protein n=1 Tax=Nostoc sp. TaxID=1180 RepID=UPI002FF483C9
MSENFRVRFGDINHGWMPVNLITNEQKFSFIASYIPYDSLAELVEALSLFLQLGYSKIVRWNAEPIDYEFLFSESNEQAMLRVIEYTNQLRVKNAKEVVFTFSGSRISLVIPFWRALRDIETRHGFEQKWQRPFPKQGMQLLKEQIHRQQHC